MRARMLPSLLLSLLLFCLAGCGEKKSAAKRSSGHPLPSPAVAKGEAGQSGGQFTLAVPAPPKTFNPLFALDGVSDGIVRLLFAELVELNLVTQEPMPALAESWSVEPDQKTWTFKMRPGVRWSD